MQTSLSKYQFPYIFFLAAVLLLPVVPARASRLYELNLLRQDPNFKIDSHWFSDEVIQEANNKIKSDASHKSLFLFEIASATAQQGKLIAALEQLAAIDDPKLKESPDFLEERAEIKSLLGFESSALEDLERIEPKYKSWKTSWHRALVLQRAGKSEQAKLELSKAVAEAERFKFGDNYHRILLETASKEHIEALPPDPEKAERLLTILHSILNLTSAPTLSEATNLMGLDEKNAENQTAGGTIAFMPLSANSPIKRANITPDAHQIHLVFDTASCGITADVIRKQFDAATEDELEPGSISGCGSGTLTLYSKKHAPGAGQFVFDAAKEPALSSFFISFKRGG